MARCAHKHEAGEWTPPECSRGSKLIMVPRSASGTVCRSSEGRRSLRTPPPECGSPAEAVRGPIARRGWKSRCDRCTHMGWAERPRRISRNSHPPS
ncbi:hypothetical protein NDU88_000852 [Pleurodeles waltl]|uniref:Uncharacterized protein n=1 Tax=Pleurodeles waltl TaxID=8319 RepID=A0AAV7TGM0_PLEWA|nr:hypothetical protein NDU88_000852 [Pleurodeles waltl]